MRILGSVVSYLCFFVNYARILYRCTAFYIGTAFPYGLCILLFQEFHPFWFFLIKWILFLVISVNTYFLRLDISSANFGRLKSKEVELVKIENNLGPQCDRFCYLGAIV